MHKNKVKILNVNFDNLKRKEILNSLEKKIITGKKTFVVTANPEIVMYAEKDPTYLSIVNNADYVIADGIGVVVGSKLINNPLPERIAGYDLMCDLLAKGNEQGWSAFFLGTKKETIEKAINNIKTNYPQLEIVGWHDGYFNWEKSDIKEEILSKKPDLIFVALGFPKQEKWISQNIQAFDKGFFMGVGGSFDVIAGEVKRAPLIWQKLNLEWLYRLIKQPSRWKRMLVLPLFLIEVLKTKVRK
ncbi:WecB/TagA/CpsF family glycosyltransferase [Neobacillus sp. SM06]|uniref:WecB/TagA/CpsF family glycosyltransferase n=1 Tax=Neobacillus sp. SM06 TaxID=3422492 RepID=UPI003D2BA3DF